MTYEEIRRSYKTSSKEEILAMYKAVDIHTVSNGQESLLHLAASFADSAAIAYLLSMGADPNAEDDIGQRPLHYLAKENRYYDITEEEVRKCTACLLDAKASTMRKDLDGKSAVILAAQEGRHEILAVMVEKGAKLTLPDKGGNTALHVACKSVSRRCDAKEEEKYFQTVKVLLEAGLEIDAKNNIGETALDLVLQKENKRIASLLQGAGDEEGSLALQAGGMDLFQAISRKDYEAVRANLELGADCEAFCEDFQDFTGMTPLGAACYLLDLESATLLLEHGADPNRKNSEGEVAISRWFQALGDSHFRFDKLKNGIPQKILKVLLDHGFAINSLIDQEENTTLIKAAKYLDYANNCNERTLSGLIIKVLLDEECDVACRNSEGETALMHLCMSRSSEAEDLRIQMLEMDADVREKDQYGNTPLMYAAKNRNHSAGKAAAEILFDFGDPQPEAVNNEGKTALEIATENNNEELVKYLLMKG